MSSESALWQSMLQPVTAIAAEAGALVRTCFQQGDFVTRQKRDATPVTEVDEAASELLIQQLQAFTPDIPVLTEEAPVPWRERRQWSRYWLVDPLDGTKEFIAGRPDFAVCIALVEGGEPRLGVIHAPMHEITYQAIQGGRAERWHQGQGQQIQVRQLHRPTQDALQVAVSRSERTAKVTRRLAPGRQVELLPVGSCALKACLVAEGGADAYVRIGPTGEWDTAAPEVIVRAAGGQLVDEHFQALRYNQSPSLENPNFYVLGDRRVNWSGVLLPPES